MKTKNVKVHNGKAPFEKILTHCTPLLICDDWPKIITPCTSSTRLDFFFRFSIWQYDKKNSSDSSSMIWASSQSFCTKLIFAQKIAVIYDTFEWVIRPADINNCYDIVSVFWTCFFLLFLQHGFVLLTDLTDDCMKNCGNWMRAIKKGKLKRVFFFDFLKK